MTLGSVGMYDMVIVHLKKNFLQFLIPVVRAYLAKHLHLTLHPKKMYLQPCKNGVRFLGIQFKPGHLLVSRRVTEHAFRTVGECNKIAFYHKPTVEETLHVQARVNAYFGLLSHYHTYRLRRNLSLSLVTSWKNRLVPAPAYRFMVRKK
jgi:hypothetical protein